MTIMKVRTMVVECGILGLLFAVLPVQSQGLKGGEVQPTPTKPNLHHVLFEVKNLSASIRFYRDILGLTLTSNSNGFATLESANAGVYLWENHQEWEKPLAAGAIRGAGLYPHFEVTDVAGMVSRFQKGGYSIVQKPIVYGWGTEAFVKDPDGYVIALVSLVAK
jgi:catechol 2,3-dioxygenase-like lactoylglutathione lyase family enzyme